MKISVAWKFVRAITFVFLTLELLASCGFSPRGATSEQTQSQTPNDVGKENSGRTELESLDPLPDRFRTAFRHATLGSSPSSNFQFSSGSVSTSPAPQTTPQVQAAPSTSTSVSTATPAAEPSVVTTTAPPAVTNSPLTVNSPAATNSSNATTPLGVPIPRIDLSQLQINVQPLDSLDDLDTKPDQQFDKFVDRHDVTLAVNDIGSTDPLDEGALDVHVLRVPRAGLRAAWDNLRQRLDANVARQDRWSLVKLTVIWNGAVMGAALTLAKTPNIIQFLGISIPTLVIGSLWTYFNYEFNYSRGPQSINRNFLLESLSLSARQKMFVGIADAMERASKAIFGRPIRFSLAAIEKFLALPEMLARSLGYELIFDAIPNNVLLQHFHMDGASWVVKPEHGFLVNAFGLFVASLMGTSLTTVANLGMESGLISTRNNIVENSKGVGGVDRRFTDEEITSEPLEARLKQEWNEMVSKDVKRRELTVQRIGTIASAFTTTLLMLVQMNVHWAESGLLAMAGLGVTLYFKPGLIRRMFLPNFVAYENFRVQKSTENPGEVAIPIPIADAKPAPLEAFIASSRGMSCSFAFQ